GLFVYPGGQFPTGSYQAANYWVDVAFALTAQDNAPPTVAAQTPAPGTTAVPVNSTVTATFSEPVQSATVSLVLKDGNGTVVPSAITYDATAMKATLTPTSSLAMNTTYTVTASGAKDTAGNTMATTSWSFTTPTPVTNWSLFPSSATPSVL